MSLVCVRGDESIAEDELRAHLAALLRLENVGVLLGAGASVGAGGQTIAQIWRAFVSEHHEIALRLANEGFISQDDVDIEHFQGDNPRTPPNLEGLLDSMEIAKQDWERRKPTSHKLKRFRQDLATLLRLTIRAAVLSEERWADPAVNLAGLGSHTTLLQRLIGARQPGQPSPWVFTTNYDLAIEWSAEAVGVHVHTGFVGIHNRAFSPQSFDLGLRNIRARGEARFGSNDIYLAKLHGSLTWERQGGLDYRELSASEMWPRLKAVLDGSGQLDDSIMVFPRAAKYLQTVGYLSGELIRRFSDFLAQSQSCLLIFGYSFEDEHLNRLLQSALLNPTLQLVVVLPEFKGAEATDAQLSSASLRQILSLSSPRVTIVGGGEEVYFDNAIGLLPDPILFDLTERELRRRIREDLEESDDAG